MCTTSPNARAGCGDGFVSARGRRACGDRRTIARPLRSRHPRGPTILTVVAGVFLPLTFLTDHRQLGRHLTRRAHSGSRRSRPSCRASAAGARRPVAASGRRPPSRESHPAAVRRKRTTSQTARPRLRRRSASTEAANEAFETAWRSFQNGSTETSRTGPLPSPGCAHRSSLPIAKGRPGNETTPSLDPGSVRAGTCTVGPAGPPCFASGAQHGVSEIPSRGSRASSFTRQAIRPEPLAAPP